MDYKQMTSPCGFGLFQLSGVLGQCGSQREGLPRGEARVFHMKGEMRGLQNARGTILFWATLNHAVFSDAQTRKTSLFAINVRFPCDHLHPYADHASVRQHNTKVFNLCLIKKNGPCNLAETKAASVKISISTAKLRVACDRESKRKMRTRPPEKWAE